MKILNLRFKEVKNLKRELTQGLRFIGTEDCSYSIVQNDKKFTVFDHKKQVKTKFEHNTWTFDNVDGAINKFNKLTKRSK